MLTCALTLLTLPPSPGASAATVGRDTPPAGATPSGTTPSGTTPSGAGIAIHGTVERLVVEAPRPRSSRTGEVTVWIRTDDDRRVRVSAEDLVGVPTGATVVVRTSAEPRADRDVHPVRSVDVLTRSTANALPPSAAGAPHVVTVVLGLPPGAQADATTPAGLTDAVRTGASGFWSRQSGGRIRFTVARAVGWLRMQHDCSDVWGLWDEARTRSGFVPGPRRHLLLYVPPGAGCPSGLGTVAPSRDAGGYAIIGGTTTGLLAHELGHNLGLGHSDALSCDDAADAVFIEQWPAGCTHDDYGDWYDVMGISWGNLGSLSTAHAQRLGLLGSDAVRSVSGPVRTTLRAVSSAGGLRSLRVTDPDGAVYVVEYRPASGVDAWLDTAADWRGLRPGVLVRRIDPEDPTRTLLLDGTPQTQVPAGGDWDRALVPGRPLRTASGRLTIRVAAATASTATIVVALDGTSPALVLEPGGRLIDGRQVTIAEAPAAWAALALR